MRITVGRFIITSVSAPAKRDVFIFNEGLQNSGSTLTVALYVYAKEQGEFEIAFAIAAILMIMTLLINLAADIVSRYF